MPNCARSLVRKSARLAPPLGTTPEHAASQSRMSHSVPTKCPPGLPSWEAQALFDWHTSARLLPRLRAKPPQGTGLEGIQACGLLLPAGTGCTSLATSLANLTHRSEASWYLGGHQQKHLVTFRHVRLTKRPCAVMMVRDPYERLRSGLRYDTAHLHRSTGQRSGLISNFQKRRTLHELLDAFRNASAPGHATVMDMYNHSVLHPMCNSGKDQCVQKRTPETPQNTFLWSQSAYLLDNDDAGAFVPSIHFLCTNDYAASWRNLLADFGIDSSVPAAHALSGRRPTSDALPYDDADARFVQDCLFPWDAFLHQRVCGGAIRRAARF